MNIDELGRSAAAGARDAATRHVDADAMLARLHRTRRNRSSAAVAGAVTALAVILGLVLSQSGGTATSTPPEASAPTVHRPTCGSRQIQCLQHKTYRIGLPVPVTATLPRTFQPQISVISPNVFEAYRNDITTTGISVAENATPVRNDGSWTRDRSAGTTARSIATWLSKRPFLIHTTLARTKVGNITAWHVSATLKPGAALTATSYRSVAPTFGVADGPTMGYNPSLIGEYTLLDIPGAGVTVIWSWSQGHSASALIGNQIFIDQLRFGKA